MINKEGLIMINNMILKYINENIFLEEFQFLLNENQKQFVSV